MGKRFAIVIGVAATGVMALGAQTAGGAGVVKYDTKLTLTKDTGVDALLHFTTVVESEGRKCERGRRVVLFKRRPGADGKLGTDRSHGGGGFLRLVIADRTATALDVVYARVKPKVRDRFVCGADRSETINAPI